jgi:tetratricopeptide (TPR) repeat protein
VHPNVRADLDLEPLFALARAARPVELETRATALLERHADSGPLWKLLGYSLWVQRKDALAALETAARLLPADAEAQCNLGNALRAHGRLAEAAACHRHAIEIDAGYAEAHNNLGSVLRDLEQWEDAAASYRRALAIKPDYAMAHHNLGLALRAMGRTQEALASHRRATVMQPDFTEAHLSMAKTLEELGRPDDAIASYRRALEGRPADAGIHQSLGTALLRRRRHEEAVASLLGSALHDQGQIEAAAASYRAALALLPDSPEMHGNLGNALMDLGHWEQAADSYRRSLALRPAHGMMYNSLGNALRLLNRAEEADATYRRGLEADPAAAATLTSLADLAADRGLFADAEQLYRRAIALDGDLPRAWAGLAGLRRMTLDDGDWLAQARRIVEQGLAPREEVHLRYALGKYHDDLQDFDEAFANYRRANELTKTYRPAHDRGKLSGTFDSLTQFYDGDWLREARSGASESRRPVFIVGMPRTGTSLAEQILASHPAVFGAGELPFWNHASPRVAAEAVRGAAADVAVRAVAADYLRLLEARSADALRVTDKMPGNFAYLGLIHAAFPEARVIHMRRDAVDTCLSIYFQNFHVIHSYTNDLGDLAHYFREYQRLMDHWRSVLPEDAVLDVPYEALTDDPETWSRRMVEFIGLPWDAACLDFHRTSRSVSTFSRWQVRQKISKASVQRWRNYARHVEPLLPLLEAGASA